VTCETYPRPHGEDSQASWEFLDRGPAPDEVAILTETVQQVVSGLEDREKLIVTLSLQGYEVQEVSQQVGCSQSKVYRVLRLVRSRLERMRDGRQ